MSTNTKLAEALRDLYQVVHESMGTGGWTPTALHASLMHAMFDAKAALAAHDAEQAAQAVPDGLCIVEVKGGSIVKAWPATDEQLLRVAIGAPAPEAQPCACWPGRSCTRTTECTKESAPAPEAQAAGQELPPLVAWAKHIDLPTLPEPHWPRGYQGGVPSGGYTADQMHAYARAAVSAANSLAQRQPLIARARDEWHLDDGPVMWWGWSGDSLGWIGEPAWIGTPLDDDWPGYHTHWTPHPAMPAGATTGEQR